MRLSSEQVQRQILTPYMQQSIELLLLPIGELQTTIEQELQNNPLLEMEEARPQESLLNPDPADFKLQIDNIMKKQERPYPYEYNEEETEEKQIRVDQSLEETLLRQLRVEFSDPTELRIGEYIIGNITEDGYLTVTSENIAEALALPDPGLIERILEVIQCFDPVGIASRNLKECLLVQAKEKFKEDGMLVSQIINNYLKELGQKKYAEIAKKMGITVDEIKQAAGLIASLDPRPARNYRPLGINIYIKPDITVTQEDEKEFHIQLTKESSPVLRINKIYRNLLKKENLKAEEREFIKEKLNQAILFIKGVEQRGQTIKEIAKIIVEKQKKFLKEGHVARIRQ